MTAGTKALVLVSVLGMVMLIGWYGNGPAGPAVSTPPSEPDLSETLLLATSPGPEPATRLADVPTAVLPLPAAEARPDVPSPMPSPTTTPPPTLEMGTPVSDPLSHRLAQARAAIDRARTAAAATGDRTEPPSGARRLRGETPSVARASGPSSGGPVTEAADVRIHEIRPEETLGHLAQRYYGSARHWDRLVEANPSIDADRLRVGQKIRIPAASVARVASKAAPATPLPDGPRHTIDEGETLSSIAADHLGDTKYWFRLYEFNRAAIGPDPDRLVVGMELAIPQ